MSSSQLFDRLAAYVEPDAIDAAVEACELFCGWMSVDERREYIQAICRGDRSHPCMAPSYLENVVFSLHESHCDVPVEVIQLAASAMYMQLRLDLEQFDGGELSFLRQVVDSAVAAGGPVCRM